MALTPGSRIGAYEIVSQLGAGGMGEVYRARDSKLKRDVAIKVLPADVAGDGERLARFQREAEVLASLNHPHIAHVYGIDDNALVMELVEGEDLSQRIARGPIPIDEALPFAKQIAEALEAAHDAGIVHRDLKPGNIKVREDGTVKVLDFGLAKAMDRLESGGFSRRSEDAEASSLQTITTPAMTMRGVILGTAAYMSPEQAKGKAVDRRADIWAFGCVLFEMLTGKRTFKGDDVTDIITSVMRDTPDWNALPGATPPSVRALLRRCLEKDPRRRTPHIAVARIEIDDAMASPGGASAEGQTNTAKRSWGLPIGVGAIAAALATAITWNVPRESTTAGDAPVLRYSIDNPLGSSGSTLAVSPDGKFIAVSGRPTDGRFPQVWLRAMDGTEFVAVPNSTGGGFVFWSPDSTEVAFYDSKQLRRWRVGSGAPQDIAELSTSVFNNSIDNGGYSFWQPDGAILVAAADGVYRVMSSSGAVTKVFADEAKPIAYRWPQPVPGTEGLLYSHFLGGTSGALLYRPSQGAPSAMLSSTLTRAQVTSHGVLLARGTGSASSMSLSAHRFQTATGALEMPGITLASDASFDFSASNNGVLVYRRGGGGVPYRFEWVDRDGKPAGESFETIDAGAFNLSRDNASLAYAESGAIVVRDLSRGVSTRLVDSGTAEPILSPDGRQIAYTNLQSSPPSITVRPSSGGQARTLLQAQGVGLTEDWSADGRYLAVNRGNIGLLVPLDGSQPVPYAELPNGSVLDEPRFSPDGRWMIYNSFDTGRHEVYLIPLPPTGERWQLSPSGGAQARWRRDGRQVFYLGLNGDVMAVDLQLTTGERPVIGAPRKLFASGLTTSPAIDQYAPNADGTRFLLRRPSAGVTSDALQVIVNWPSLLPEK